MEDVVDLTASATPPAPAPAAATRDAAQFDGSSAAKAIALEEDEPPRNSEAQQAATADPEQPAAADAEQPAAADAEQPHASAARDPLRCSRCERPFANRGACVSHERACDGTKWIADPKKARKKDRKPGAPAYSRARLELLSSVGFAMCQDLVPPPSGPDEPAAELPSWARVSQHWLGNVKVRRTGSSGGGGGDDDDDDDDDECIGEAYQAELPPFESHPPVSASALDALSVRALKEQIRERGLDASDCVEKRELVELLVANSPPLAADAGVRGGVRLTGDDVEVALARATAARLTAAAFGRDAERAAAYWPDADDLRVWPPPLPPPPAGGAGRAAAPTSVSCERCGRTFGNMGAKAVHMRSGVCGGGGGSGGDGGGDGGGAAAGAKRKAAGDNHRVYDATGECLGCRPNSHKRHTCGRGKYAAEPRPPPAEPRAPPAPAHRPQPRRPKPEQPKPGARLPPWSGELAGAVPESARLVSHAPAGWARFGRPPGASDDDVEPAPPPPLPPEPAAVRRPPPPQEQAGGVYVVERLLARRDGPRGGMQYLVRWEGYGEEDDSWEDESNINEAALRDFEERQARARRG